MADIWTTSKRSDVMSKVRSCGNQSTELRLIKIFRTNKIIGWRRHQKLFGKPDFVFRRQRVCIFVDGCFWHGCPNCYRRPQSNQYYWDTKIQHNKLRDIEVSKELGNLGWQVLRIWEHELSEKRRTNLLQRFRDHGFLIQLPEN